MKLIYEFPDYCENCPLMELAVENGIFQTISQYEDSSQQVEEFNSPILWCIHAEVCEKWQEVLKIQTQKT